MSQFFIFSSSSSSSSSSWIHCFIFLTLVVHLLPLFSINVNGELQRGPPVVLPDELKSLQVVQLGQEFRIVCPIEGDPTPIIDWHKDGESITPAWSPRFRIINSKILRIRSVYSEDVGIYECKGVNGFGSQIARTRLIVSDEEMVGPDEKFPNNYNNNNNNERRRVADSHSNNNKNIANINTTPKLTPETIEQNGPLHVTYGNTIRLRCEAKGNPTPKINWLKNGKSVGDKLWKWTSWTLILNKVTVEDSGVYTCVANSTGGKIEHNIQLFVTEIVEKKRPELATGDPNNTTVLVGNEAILECVVRASTSTLPPHIKWLKRVPDEDYYVKSSSRGGGRHKHRLLPSDNHHVLVIQETQDKGIRVIESQKNGTFISKLIIERSEFSHSGSYICLATNSAGYSFKEIAILTVHSDSSGLSVGSSSSSTTPSSTQSSLSLPILVIGISLGATLLMIGGACILRKYQERRQPKQLSKSITPLKKLGSTCSNTGTVIPPIISIGSTNYSSASKNAKYYPLHHQQRRTSSNNKEGYDCHQLLVSTTSTHSSSSSSGHQDSPNLIETVDNGTNHLICGGNATSTKYHHYHHHHHNGRGKGTTIKLVGEDPMVELSGSGRPSRCTCFEHHEAIEIDELRPSTAATMRTYEHCNHVLNFMAPPSSSSSASPSSSTHHHHHHQSSSHFGGGHWR